MNNSEGGATDTALGSEIEKLEMAVRAYQQEVA